MGEEREKAPLKCELVYYHYHNMNGGIVSNRLHQEFKCGLVMAYQYSRPVAPIHQIFP